MYIDKPTYNSYKACPEMLDHKAYERAFYAYFCSFGGKKWGGYAVGSDLNPADGRNPANEARNDLIKGQGKDAVGLRNNLEHAIMLSADYTDLPYVDHSLIYCDPPYKQTTNYKDASFDSDYFYKWCRAMAIKGHTVLVSEYSAPDDFICVWAKDKQVSLSRTDYNTKTERLYLVPKR